MTDESQPPRQPRVVLITGAPGSGKTTLGTKLSRALQIPFLARDDVRRGLFFTAGGWGDRPGWVPSSDASVEAFLTMLETTASLGVSCIAEYVLTTDRTADLERVTAAGNCVVIITRCERSVERFENRHRGDRLINREPVLDALGYATIEDHTTHALERVHALTEGMRTDFDVPTLTVRTDDGYDPTIEAVVDFVIGDD